MKAKHFVLSAFATVLACAPGALADTLNFSFSGGSISSSGTLSVSATSTPGSYAITGISGTFADTKDGISGAITGLYQPVSYIAPQPPAYTAPPPAFTTSGFSYDDTFYPGGDSPHNCADYPFFGGELDVYGIAFNVGVGYVADLWSDGYIPGLGLIYAAGDGNATTLLDDPNAGGADPTMLVGVPVSLVTTPEPGSLCMLAMGLLGVVPIFGRKRRRAAR